jgi:soluble lytic murein transglycosylase-like protein
MRMFKLKMYAYGFALPLFGFLANSSHATTENCYVVAGQRYNIDPVLIYSIAEQESTHNARAFNSNSNGTSDYGVMQVNSSWLPVLHKEYGANKQDLYDPCYNIHVGSWILAQSFQRLGYSWNAVGAYNVGFSPTQNKERLRVEYANKIYARYAKNCTIYRCTGSFRMY